MILGIAKTLTAIVAFMHIYFLWLEMFAWTTKAKKVFRNFPSDLFEPTKSMAANQGLYNGFLAAGLIWCLTINDSQWALYIALFFLSCVTIAGIFGGISVSKKIFFIQGMPAIVAIILWLYANQNLIFRWDF
ncbi:DUF1304 domain-containing protein [uncultured Croceitalea sp.]|uniref:DUF1304 domain-containing protein n=1 Tax=uncultured Croceitalea sp. TaxID=1798908 RepID=UPI00374E749B